MSEGRLPEKCHECGQLIEHENDSPIVVGDFVLRPGFNTVDYAGQSLRLTPQEFETLRFIAKKRGAIARKFSIYTAVFERPDGEPESKIVDVVVCKVRAKLAKIGAGDAIKTVWGVGYQFDSTNGSPPQPTGQMDRSEWRRDRRGG